MTNQKNRISMRHCAVSVIFLATTLGISAPANADHAIGFSWPRTGPELTVPIVNNSGPAWQDAINTAVTNWNQSSVIESPLLPQENAAAACPLREGRIIICDNNWTTKEAKGYYVKIQWFTSQGVVGKATIKLNQRSSLAETPLQKKRIVCLALGTVYGLDLQDFDFDNPDLEDGQGRTSCMDFSSTPDDNIQPNDHDYEQLEEIYADSVTDFGMRSFDSSGQDGQSTETENWGEAIRFDSRGRPTHFRKQVGENGQITTMVLRDENP
jgi:hypothetical protein